MSSVYDVIDQANRSMQECVNGMEYVLPEDLGLDRRSCYRLWVGDDCIVVREHEDKVLMYYGGFEYVDPGSKSIVGEYVIYFDSDERVKEHIQYRSRTEQGAE